MITFLLEAVEASLCYFFKNWLMKHKSPNLLKPLGTIIHQNSQFYYPSEPFSFHHFNVRHPVEALVSEIGTGSIFCLSFSLSNRVGDFHFKYQREYTYVHTISLLQIFDDFYCKCRCKDDSNGPLDCLRSTGLVT